jgi:hypothetical protein
MPVEPDRKIGNVNWKIRNAQDGNHGYSYGMLSINPCSQATARVQVVLKQSPELREKLYLPILIIQRFLVPWTFSPCTPSQP